MGRVYVSFKATAGEFSLYRRRTSFLLVYEYYMKGKMFDRFFFLLVREGLKLKSSIVPMYTGK